MSFAINQPPHLEKYFVSQNDTRENWIFAGVKSALARPRLFAKKHGKKAQPLEGKDIIY